MKRFGNLIAVNNLSFNVDKGNIIGLLGRNGAGKSTTFRIILNLIKPDAGEVTLDDKKINLKILYDIGYLPEVRSLLTNLKVKEQVQYYANIKGLSNKDFRKNWEKWASLLEIKHYSNQKIKSLSKGNQQKVQFVCALIHDPSIVILDEPFSGLDIVNVSIIEKLIISLKNANKTIIFASHRIDDVEKFCKDIIILDHGKIVQFGKIEEIRKQFQKEEIIKIKFFTDTEKIITTINDLKENYKGEIQVDQKDTFWYFKVLNVELLNIIKKTFMTQFFEDIEKFEISYPSLNDIFFASVDNKGLNNLANNKIDDIFVKKQYEKKALHIINQKLEEGKKNNEVSI
ncbi:ATP-binding cassette domain-containing protein [symbiont of Argiope bruennichi]|uniref:ABC transporter ATP-binding protein n=1 Tax=symbiont of Argiope bruennichi TaxID=2810479 RepID=UPI003DA445A2